VVARWWVVGERRAWLFSPLLSLSLLSAPLLLAAISFLVPGWLLPCLLLLRRACGDGGGGGRARVGTERRGPACAAVLCWERGSSVRLPCGMPRCYRQIITRLILSPTPSCCHLNCVRIQLSSQLFEVELLLISSPVYSFSSFVRRCLFIYRQLNPYHETGVSKASNAGGRLLSHAGIGEAAV
jgi:hypothetical protein